MKTIAKQYISNNKDKSSYTSIFKHYYEKSEKKTPKEGDIFALLNIQAEKDVNVERVAKFVWDSIVDGYLYSISETTNESLKDSINSGVEKVKELIKHDKELEKTGIDVSFTIVLVKQEGVYVGLFGEGDVFSFKNDNLVNISDILKEKNANTAGIALGNEDVLMVSSAGLLQESFPELSRSKDGKSLWKYLTTLGEKLEGTNSLLYLVQEKEEKPTKEVVQEQLPVKVKKESSPVVEKVKENTEKILKPIGKLKDIKKGDGQTTLQDFREKLKAKERLNKVKVFAGGIWKKVAPFFKKVGAFLSEKSSNLQERVSQKFGRKKWYKKIASKVSLMGGRKKSRGVQGMRIDNYKQKDLRSKRFKLLGMALVIIVLLALGINFTIKMREAREISARAEESFTKVEDLIGKVEDNFAVDKDASETYLFQAEKALEEVPGELNEEDAAKYEELKERILELGDTLYKRIGVVEKDSRLDTFLDTRLAFGEGSDVKDVTIYKDRYENEYLVAADAGRSTVYRVSLYDKDVKALPDTEGLVKEPKFVYVGNNGVYVYDQEEGMLKAPFDEEGWFTSFIKLSGLSVSDIRSEEIAAMTVWTENDNVYFLSQDRSAFLRSSAAYGNSYGLPYEYFSDEDMATSTDMVADISIYFVVPEEPYVLRFNYNFFEAKYVEAPLGVVGFDGDYGTPTKAFTGDSLDHPLYVFDSKGRRFLQLEKPIESGADIRHPDKVSLLSQYLYRGEKDSVWSDVKNFVVNNNGSNMYILDGSVIWKLVL
jgi:hypothetical protein